jgi:hypothetical protein
VDISDYNGRASTAGFHTNEASMNHKINRSMAINHENRAWELRCKGWSQARIAAELGLTQSGICKILERANRKEMERGSEISSEGQTVRTEPQMFDSARLDMFNTCPNGVSITCGLLEDGTYQWVARWRRKRVVARSIREALDKLADRLNLKAPSQAPVKFRAYVHRRTEEDYKR